MSLLNVILKRTMFVLLAILTFSNVNSQDHIKLIAEGERDFEKIRSVFYDNWNRTGQSKSAYKKFRRWEEFMKPRLVDGKLPTSYHFSKSISEYQLVLEKGASSRTGQSTNWESIGPYEWDVAPNGYSPGNGRVNCITVDPNNENRIFAGAAGGGLWISLDGGSTWSTTTDELAVLGITDIYISPDDPDEIIILTGDAYGSNTPSVGLLKSTDGGNTWEEMNLSFDRASYALFYKFEVNPDNTDIMFVAGNGHGIYSSTDAGENWDIVLSDGVSDLVFHPTDPNIIYAAAGFESVSNQVTLFKSIDGGDTWSDYVFEFPDLDKSLGRKAIAVSPDNPDAVYVLATSDDSTFGGLFRSDDGFETLDVQSSSPNIFGYSKIGDDTDGQGWYDLAIAVNPNDENEIYASGVHIWKSSDGGVIWELQNYWVWDDPQYPYVHADNHTLDFAHGKLYAGGDGGIFVTSDDGATFTDLSPGMGIGQFYRIGVHPTTEDIVIGGLQDNGSFLRFNDQWSQLFGADGMDALIDHTDPSIMFSEYQFGGILRYSDYGNVIDHYVENDESESGGWITPFIMHPTDNNTLYFGYQNVWKSTDGGFTLDRISDFGVGGTVAILKQHPTITENMLVYIDNVLYITENEGEEWTNITSGLPAANLTDATFNFLNPDEIWVTFSNYESEDKVYRSTDRGSSWENVSGGLPEVPINCILSQNVCDEKMYVGTEIGVFTRNNAQESWELYGGGLPNVVVRELELQYATGKLYAATYGRGVWKVDVDVDISDQTLTFEAIEDKAYGDPDFDLVASVDSGLDVEFISSDTDVISIDGNVATVVGTGEVTITARQTGSCLYNAVAESQNIIVSKADQTITFETLSDRFDVEGSFELQAEASSGLSVSFESSDNSILFIVNNTATIRGEGVVTVTAIQNGDDNYNAAEPVEQTQAILVLGFEDLPEGMKVFPNPITNGLLNILIPQSNSKTDISVYDINGKEVLSKKYGHSRKEIQLNMTKLEKGMYVIRINEISLRILKN